MKLHAAKIGGHWAITDGPVPHDELYGNHPKVLEWLNGWYTSDRVVKVLKEWYQIRSK